MVLDVVTTVSDVRQAVAAARKRGLNIGFVPTMGALHAGHRSLMEIARQETGYVVVSIFVNPTQFGPTEDFQKYPRTFDADLALCRETGADLVFMPSVEEVYPSGACTWVEVRGLGDVLCGRSRPGHFRGVATVVAKLFNMVQPDVAFFGQKDAQQARIIRQVIRDLNFPIELRICPTVREPDGLALSSRNAYLSVEQRRHAACLYRALEAGRQLVAQGERDASRVRVAMISVIESIPGAELDYVELVDPETLQPANHIQAEVLAAVAVRFGTTRLIDNMVLKT
jgi:pantoate--beta-alanine ligase